MMNSTVDRQVYLDCVNKRRQLADMLIQVEMDNLEYLPLRNLDLRRTF